MKHHINRALSALLAIILTFLSFPVVSAAEIIKSQDINQKLAKEDVLTEDNESENVFILQEDTTKRGEFEKHYLCSDGTYVVATYAEAIHYKNDNGIWVDVDNRPIQTSTGDYVTGNGDFGIRVPGSAEEGHLIRMDKGTHSISWTLSADKKAKNLQVNSTGNTQAQKPVSSQKIQVNATQVQKAISGKEGSQEEYSTSGEEAIFDLPNVFGKVRYENLFGVDEGVSVVYTTYHNKIEEDIYIEKPTDITSFSMEVEATDLTPRLNADNSVDFLDNNGNMCYHVGIPYMVDANCVVLNEIETTVTRSGDI